MQVTVIRPGELGPDETSLWDRFQKSSIDLRNPFLSYTFARIVDKHRTTARVAVVEDAGSIQAFLPFDLWPQRIGRPIGYPMNNLQGFITELETFDVKQVLLKAGLRGWRYDAVPISQRALAPHHYAEAVFDAPIIDLSDGFESYLESRSRKLRKEYGRQWRQLEREVGQVSLEWGAASPEYVRQLIDWKCAKFGGSRELFAERAAGRILEELAVSRSEDCRGVVTVLHAGDQVACVLASLSGFDVLSAWFIGHDPAMEKFSPGRLMFLATAEEVARRGMRELDFGPGRDEYKGRLSNGSRPVAGGAVWVIPGERVARGLYRRFYLEAGKGNGS